MQDIQINVGESTLGDSNQRFIKSLQAHFESLIPQVLKEPLQLNSSDALSALSQPLQELFPNLSKEHGHILNGQSNIQYVQKTSKKRVAVLFSGGPAPGGHNIISGLLDALKDAHPENELLGVLKGPKGLLEGRFMSIDEKESFYCTGGFDLLGTDRTKISTLEQFEQVKGIIEAHQIDGLVIVGGDDSNTNATFLAEYLYGSCVIVGAPKTIDGDLQYKDLVPISFGFDTATKVYAELVSNIMNDAASTQKYWHFIKLMGRNASHVSLEVALKTKAHISLITEEILQGKVSFKALLERISKAIKTRQEAGFNYGVMLIPEGVVDALSFSKETLENLVGEGYAYDAHGNLNVSAIDSAKLLAEHLKDVMPKGVSIKTHFFGYEGRCATPSYFDNLYTYASGKLAATLILEEKTGYLAGVSGFDGKLCFNAVPLTAMLHQERRHNKEAWVIKKVLVDLDSPAYQAFVQAQESCLLQEKSLKQSPRQFFGPSSLDLPLSLMLNQGYDTDKMRCLDEKNNP